MIAEIDYSPEIVAIVAMKNRPECSTSLFDPGPVGHFLFCNDRGDHMETSLKK